MNIVHCSNQALDKHYDRLKELTLGNRGMMSKLLDEARNPDYHTISKKYAKLKAILAFQDGKIIGWAVLWPFDLVGVFVDAKYRRKGIATKLVSSLKKKNKKMWSLTNSIIGKKFYSKLKITNDGV